MPVHDWSRVDAGIFHDLHLGWIDGLRAVLNRTLLPEPFYALAEPVLGGTVPDVLTLRSQQREGLDTLTPAALHDDTVENPLASVSTTVVQELPPAGAYSALARHIVIKSALRDDQVVAVIEIVSKANKASREHRDHFLTKSVEFLRNGVHLAILDVQPSTALVPEGFHALICEAHAESPLAMPPDCRLQMASYQVLEDGTTRSHVVPRRVGDTLPDMPVFLTAHHYVEIPLEETYLTAFGNLPRRFRQLLEA